MILLTICTCVLVLVSLLLCMNFLLASHKPDQEKISSYECGFESVGGPRSQFQIAFYLVALLFLIFDLEIACFYPLITILYHVDICGIATALLFLAVLTAGFVFEYGSGALHFTVARKDPLQTSEMAITACS